MKKNGSTFIIAIFLCISCFAQDSLYQQLINVATSRSEFFISIKPLSDFKIELKDTSYYLGNLMESSRFEKDSIGTGLIAELIRNCKKPDMRGWTDAELSKFVLVKNRIEKIDAKKALLKFMSTDEKLLKDQQDQISNYNKTNSKKRLINSFSRPVFDKTRQFAIIVNDVPNDGGSTTLYHFEKNQWKRIGNLEQWVHMNM